MTDSDCHVVLLPFMAYGHMIPMADMAVLFASRGLQTTVITTPSNAHRFTRSIHNTIDYPHQISLKIIEFEPGFPPEIDNLDQPFSNQHLSTLLEAISTLEGPFRQFVRDFRPDCVVSDMFYPWTTEIAAEFNIPRIVFHGTGFFAMCVSDAVRSYGPTGSERFTVPNLPDEIELSRKELPNIERESFKDFLKAIIDAIEAEAKSYGVIFNSFYELEPEYVHHYREVMKRKAWHVGPVSLCNKSTEDKIERGRKSAINEHECLKWLESKPPNSVVYVSFGSIVKVTSVQIHEIAMGLEACEVNFIWVVKKDQETLIPDGFEARMKAEGRGLIIEGWAPQVLILDHDSVGGFVSHCGWNSVLEGILGGVAMVAWPVMAEQFYNAKLVTNVLQIGVSIGDVEWSVDSTCDGVKRDMIEKVVARVMSVEEGEEMRKRTRLLKDKAKATVEEGGSSYSDLTVFIQNIKTFNTGIKIIESQ